MMNELLDVVIETSQNGGVVINGVETANTENNDCELSPEQWAALRRAAINSAKDFASQWGKYFPVRIILFDQYGGG
jgi:hypothetical protein